MTDWGTFEHSPEIIDRIMAHNWGVTEPPITPPTEPPTEPPPEGNMTKIYGLHDRGGEHLMLEGGWVLITEEIGRDPHDHSGMLFSDLVGKGLTPIVRLNHGYGSTGTIPLPDFYQDFAIRVGNFISASSGCALWIIGNEPNHQAEWPDGNAIFPDQYARCFDMCLDRVPMGRGDTLLIAGPGPWNASVKYGGNNRGDWVQYLTDIIHSLRSFDTNDNEYKISLHTYTHGHDPNLVTSTATMGAPFTDRLYHFYAYRDFITGLKGMNWSGALYITEMNGNDKDWPGGNNGWIGAAYEEINHWNTVGDSRYPIKCGIVFRWQDDPLGWSIEPRPAVQDDFRFAYVKGYLSPIVDPPIDPPPIDPPIDPPPLHPPPIDPPIDPPPIDPPPIDPPTNPYPGMPELAKFPRPLDDTHRGLHWAPDTSRWGGPEWNDKWYPWLKESGVKWVKVLDDGGGSNLELIMRLLEMGIMPVVRMYFHEAYPAPVPGGAIEYAHQLTDLGVVYFEFGNEPDLSLEWKGGNRPENWEEIVVDRFIAVFDAMAGTQAVCLFDAYGPGGRGNPFQMIKDRGRDDVLANMVISLHNYALGRPLTYPNDGIADLGIPYSQAEYDSLTVDDWGPALTTEPWQWVWERTLHDINIEIADKANPNLTPLVDSTGFRAFEYLDHLFFEAAGFHAPIMTTEGGYSTGQRAGTTGGDDFRYPKPTAKYQSDQTMKMFDEYPTPPYYFSNMIWFIAGHQMGTSAASYEPQGPTFTDWYNTLFNLQGQLPYAQRLIDEPGRIRANGPVPDNWSQWLDPPAHAGRDIGVEFKFCDPKISVVPYEGAVGSEYWHINKMEYVRNIGGYVYFRCLSADGIPVESIMAQLSDPWGNTYQAPTKGEADQGWGNLSMGGHPPGTYIFTILGSSDQAINLGNFLIGNVGHGLCNIYIELQSKAKGESPMPPTWNWATDFDNRALAQERDTGIPLNDTGTLAGNEGPKLVVISNPNVPAGQWYYKVIGAYHLHQEENDFNHNAYVAIFDENENYLGPLPVAVKWGWEGQGDEEPSPPVELKAPPERGGVAMFWGQRVWMSTNDNNFVSGTASDIHTMLEDDPPGNTRGHHSFYVVFKKVLSGGGSPPLPDRPPTAQIDAPVVARTNFLFMVSASQSNPGTNPIANYSWDFGDGRPAILGMTVNYVYIQSGNYTVRLTVTDSKGLTGTDNHSIVCTTEPIEPPDPPTEGPTPPGWLEKWSEVAATTFFYVTGGLLFLEAVRYIEWLMSR